MGTSSHAEIHVRLRKCQLCEESFGHCPIMMLPGVDEDRNDLGVVTHLSEQRSNLHEVGASPYDIHNFHQNCLSLLGATHPNRVIKDLGIVEATGSKPADY